jgi:uncharacterized membrane protein YbaN (DUF454 family)
MYNAESAMYDIRKIVLIFLGTVFVALGVIGMFLPLVPTTVFLLLAAFCYSRSSERCHTWLITNRWCGQYIKNYIDGVGMTVRDKATTISLLWVTLSVSMWLVSARLWLVALLAAVGAGVTVHLLWLKTRRDDIDAADAPTP